MFAAAGILILTVYIQGSRRVETVYEAQRIESPTSRGLFQVVRTETPDTSVLIFKKPRALALYTNRRAAVYAPGQMNDPWRFVEKIRATHFISVRPSRQDSQFVAALKQDRPNAVRELFANDQFAVYQLSAAPPDPPDR